MRNDRLLLQDILDAIVIIQQYTPGTRAEFDQNPPVQSHILRHIQIIGEAVSRLSPTLKERHPTIPWRQIVATRNILVHGYFQIDVNEIWNTAQRDIPKLRSQIETILTAMP